MRMSANKKINASAPASPKDVVAGALARRAGKVLGIAIAGVLVLLAGAFVVVVAVMPKPEKDKQQQDIPAVNVSVLHVEPIGNFRDAFTIPGSIEPNSVVRVSAEVPGRIEQITGVEGRAIKAGDKLAELNTDLLKAALDQAKASMDFDARELLRVKDLLSGGVATSMEHDQARAKADASKATFDAARAQLDRAVIYAPTSGTLNKVPVEKGEYVTPGMVVAEIVETDPVLVVVEVPERDMRFIRLGQRETILADALGGKEFAGRIHYISAVADAASRTTRVELVVPNGDGELKSGQIVTVHMERQTIADTIMVPLEAVISLEKGYRVYVVENGLAQPRDVKLGVLKSRDVQVVSGLSAGDDVIVRGHYYVGPGQAVKVVGQGDQVEPNQPGAAPATAPAIQPDTQPTNNSATNTPTQRAMAHGAQPANGGPNGAEECSNGWSEVPAGRAKPVEGEYFHFLLAPAGAKEDLLRPYRGGFVMTPSSTGFAALHPWLQPYAPLGGLRPAGRETGNGRLFNDCRLYAVTLTPVRGPKGRPFGLSKTSPVKAEGSRGAAVQISNSAEGDKP